MTNTALVITALIIGLIIVIPISFYLSGQDFREEEAPVTESFSPLFPPDKTIAPLPITEPAPAPKPAGLPPPPKFPDRNLGGQAPPPTGFTTAPIDLKSLIPVLPPAPVSEPSRLLTLPEVATAELKVSADGFDTFDDYLEYFTKNTKNINFDNLKFSKILKHPSGMFLLPPELIDKALASRNWNEVHESLNVFKEFLSAKIEYLKSIKVKGEAIEWNKNMIAADRLTLELIDKSLVLESGSLRESEFRNYYQSYQDTITFHNKRFKSLSETFFSKEDIFIKFLRFAGLWPALAQAQSLAGLTFGGLITVAIPCLCIASFNLHFTPIYVTGLGQLPLPDFPLLITAATIASPLLYLYKAPFTGNWILGGFIPNGIPPQPLECIALIPTIPPVCAPIDIFFGVITIAGTSLVP